MNLPLHKESLHHAYVLEGVREATVEALFTFLETELKVVRSGNPDLFVRAYDALSIDDARELIDRHSRKTIAGGKKIFILSLNSIAWEAQNALLKLFEEPTSDTHFFIVTSNAQFLLPTLRSRLQLLKLNDTESHEAANQFLKITIPRRLKWITETLDDEEQGKEKLRALFISLENKLGADSKKHHEALQELLTLKRHAQSRSASLKMIGELLAIRLPQL